MAQTGEKNPRRASGVLLVPRLMLVDTLIEDEKPSRLSTEERSSAHLYSVPQVTQKQRTKQNL